MDAFYVQLEMTSFHWTDNYTTIQYTKPSKKQTMNNITTATRTCIKFYDKDIEIQSILF